MAPREKVPPAPPPPIPPEAAEPADAVADPQLAGRNHPEFDPRTGRRWVAPVAGSEEPAEPPKDVKDTGRRLLGDK